MEAMEDCNSWRHVKSGDNHFIIKRTLLDDHFQILVTNFIRLWSVEGTAGDLLTMCKKENPLWELEESGAIQNVFKLFDKNLDVLCVDIGDNSSCVTLKLSANVDRVRFVLVWCLTEEGPDMFFKEVTRPMLYTVEDLFRRQEVLCGEIKRKDCEINDYKLEFGKRQWPRIITDPFCEEEFLKSKFHLEGVSYNNAVEDVSCNPYIIRLLNEYSCLDIRIPQTDELEIKAKTETSPKPDASTSKENSCTVKEKEKVVKREPKTEEESPPKRKRKVKVTL